MSSVRVLEKLSKAPLPVSLMSEAKHSEDLQSRPAPAIPLELVSPRTVASSALPYAPVLHIWHDEKPLPSVHPHAAPSMSLDRISPLLMMSQEEYKIVGDENYNQKFLILKLSAFAIQLEKKLETELGCEVKKIPAKLKSSDVAFSPVRPLSPLDKLKIIKYFHKNINMSLGICYSLDLIVLGIVLLKRNPTLFFNFVKAVIEYSTEGLLKIEEQMSRLFFTVLWLQFPDHYSDNKYKLNNTKELLSEITGLPIDYSRAEMMKEYSRENFMRLVNNLDVNKSMRVTALTNARGFLKSFSKFKFPQFHSLGIYRDEQSNFLFYDSNYMNGEVKRIAYADRENIYDELIDRSYHVFKKPVPSSLYLNFDVLQVGPAADVSEDLVNRTKCGCACW